ncbi:MAG: family 10 glycosylhydrolase [Candidatus Omnitrophota bacterium]
MLYKRVFLITLIFLIALTVIPFNLPAEESPRVGTWVTVFSPEKPFDSRANSDRLIETCKKCGIQDIYLQLYRADKAYYDSDLTERGLPKEIQQDTLTYLINTAKDNNLKIHAWINLLSIAQNENSNIVKKFGEEVLTMDQYGKSSMKGTNTIDKYYIREPQIFLEPGDPRVRKYFADIAEEIIKKYPSLSGLHLDYIRYPFIVPFLPGSRFSSHGISYGYGKSNIERFEKDTGLNVNTMQKTRENFQAWDDWRRKQVTLLVGAISQRVRALSPQIEISCAINPTIDRAYLSSFQDWPEWLDKGFADHVVAMNYTDDSRLMELNSRSLSAIRPGKKVHIGITAYLLKDNIEEFKNQFASLQKLSCPGIVLFSYDTIAESEEIQELLKNELGRK